MLYKNILDSLFPGYAQNYLEEQAALEIHRQEKTENTIHHKKKPKPFDGGDLSSIMNASDFQSDMDNGQDSDLDSPEKKLEFDATAELEF